MGEQIAAGRGALARGRSLRAREEGSPVAALLSLLWHEDGAVRRAAALALSGGDQNSAYTPDYGYFASAFQRGVSERADLFPDTASARYEAALESLRALLNQCIADIRAMSNMRYSFLSSALYLALLSTCRDTVEAIRRLRVSAVHPELCELLWNLARPDVTRRLNGQDNELLAQTARLALGALSPDEIPGFWQGLSCRPLPQRQALAPTLACFNDRRAVPHLLCALEGQLPGVAEAIIECLGRLGDARALPALSEIAAEGHWLLRPLSRTAISSIRRAQASSPARTLLRPLGTEHEDDTASLLRSLPNGPVAVEPPEEMLRVAEFE